MQNILQTLVNNLVSWVTSHGPRILIIFVCAYLISKFASVFLEKIVRKAIVSNNYLSAEAERKREDTLIAVFDGVLKILIWIVIVLTIISELGIDIVPFLTGAGIIGLAIGFGAQYIVRDFANGLFIILENQYRVGDIITVDNVCGTVEGINLRMTVLRDFDGAVHHVPNGEIKRAANLSKDFAKTNLRVGISYNANLEKVIEVVNQVGQEMIQDEAWKDDINEAPQFVRVDDFADSAVIIKISGEVQPLKQWDVLGELRKRIKIAFDKNGIEIPFPQVVVHQAEK